jgi:hypothetical protein
MADSEARPSGRSEGRRERRETVPTLGLGVLASTGLDELRAGLESCRAENLFSLFDESLVFLPAMTADGAALADEFELPYEGSAASLGAAAGMKALASEMASDVVLLIADDARLVEPRAEAARQLALACRAVARAEVMAFRMRSIAQPGEPFPERAAYSRLWGKGMAKLRRAFAGDAAHAVAGLAVYAEAAPEARFPDEMTRTEEGWLSVSAAVMPWTDDVILIRRDFFLETIVAGAEARDGRRLDLAATWLGPRWRGSGWRIGVDKGLFTRAPMGGGRTRGG